MLVNQGTYSSNYIDLQSTVEALKNPKLRYVTDGLITIGSGKGSTVPKCCKKTRL